MIAEMERAFEARDRVGEDGTDDRPTGSRFDPDPPFELADRDWVSATGSIWAADSPRLMFDMLDMFERVGLREVITGYLGERPAISVNKCTLRKVDASAGTAWHQDGAFLGDGVRALNVWMSLSRLRTSTRPASTSSRDGSTTSSATGTEGAIFEWSVADQVAREAAGEAGHRPADHSSRATSSSSTTSSCTARRSSPTCRTRATRSRAGSSDRPASRTITSPIAF